MHPSRIKNRQLKFTIFLMRIKLDLNIAPLGLNLPVVFGFRVPLHFDDYQGDVIFLFQAF